MVRFLIIAFILVTTALSNILIAQESPQKTQKNPKAQETDPQKKTPSISQLISDESYNASKERRQELKKILSDREKRENSHLRYTKLISIDGRLAKVYKRKLFLIKEYKRYAKQLKSEQEKLVLCRLFKDEPDNPIFKSSYPLTFQKRNYERIVASIPNREKSVQKNLDRQNKRKQELIDLHSYITGLEEILAYTQEQNKLSAKLPTPKTYAPKYIYHSNGNIKHNNSKKRQIPIIHGTYKGIITEHITYKGTGDEKDITKFYIIRPTYYFFTDTERSTLYISRDPKQEPDLVKRFQDKEKIYFAKYCSTSATSDDLFILTKDYRFYSKHREAYLGNRDHHPEVYNKGKYIAIRFLSNTKFQDHIENKQARSAFRLELVKVSDEIPKSFHNGVFTQIALVEERERIARENAEKYAEINQAIFYGVLAGFAYGSYKAVKGVGGFVKDTFSSKPYFDRPHYQNYNYSNNYITRAEAQNLAQQIQADVQKQLKQQGTSIEEIYNSMSPEEKQEAERIGREMMGR